ncbi:hypothetical protein B5D80_00235 [Micromonospora wenchangensis]|uniref:HNH endonuclease n=2 Tax=Micromonospora wenchangensis TaxID=1185415 RepID=A0A246RTM2_9ACTN|nr:hypothetical protein B5D80_00235 [Micromonospora wenchangensis]
MINLGVGIDRSVWGWRSSALDVRGGDARRVARTMRIGDQLILGWWGPNPRADMSAYLAGRLRRLVVTRITTPLYQDSTPVWPDEGESFPERVQLRVLDIVEDVPGNMLGESAMGALRKSANTNGVPVEASPVPLAVLFSGEGDAAEPGDDEEGPDRVDSGEDLDVYSLVIRRKEQRRLRRLKFGDSAVVRCDLCGRYASRHLVVLAHIKRRADSSYHERLDNANVMAACLLGCDALFEYGHIYVDAEGRIRPGRAFGTAAVEPVSALDGRSCAAFDAASAPYFAAHRARFGDAALVDQGSGWKLDYELDSDHGGSMPHDRALAGIGGNAGR